MSFHRSRLFPAVFASLALAHAAPAFGAATAGPPALEQEPPAQAEAVRPAPENACIVAGKVLCSEYGTRYREPLTLVFVEGGRRFSAEINQDTGRFQAELARGTAYEMRIEFDGNGFSVGRLELPAGAGDTCGKYLEVYHPGSMLELVWEARAGDSGGSMDFRLKDAPAR